MTIQELAQACANAINNQCTDKPLVMLVGGNKGIFPRKGWPRPVHRQWDAQVDDGSRHVYWYDAWNVLAALTAHGYIDAVGPDGRSLAKEPAR